MKSKVLCRLSPGHPRQSKASRSNRRFSWRDLSEFRFGLFPCLHFPIELLVLIFKLSHVHLSELTPFHIFFVILFFVNQSGSGGSAYIVPERDLEKVRSTLKSLFREWSSDGAAERQLCYQPLLDELLHYYPDPATR